MLMNGYDRSLRQLKDRVNWLSTDVLEMLERSLRSLFTQNNGLAHDVLLHDDEVDDATNQIEEDSLQLISIQQPRQKDLRMMAAALRNARDLERIGDYSCDIAEVTELLADQPYFMDISILEKMGNITMEMVSQAVDSVCHRDAPLAFQVAQRDDVVDDLYRTVYETLMSAMRTDSATVDQASHLSLVARYLERIADHAVNIAEMAVFVETGEHRPFRAMAHTSSGTHG